MFTGIIESVGRIKAVIKEGGNIRFLISSPISKDLKVDQSLAHDGVCLTVEKQNDDYHEVVAVLETLHKTNLSTWAEGRLVNLERAMKVGGRLDGHMVQGHVDTVCTITSIEDKNGSWVLSYLSKSKVLMVEKGSVTINGTSLTCFDVTDHTFSITIIPYTYEHTNVHQLKVGDIVNIEFDILGKYVVKLLKDTSGENEGSLNPSIFSWQF
jgi:riboflavin synthase